jgi:hypothetical protein
LPETLFVVNYEGDRIDLIQQLIDDEYNPFPVSVHDDMLDAMARITDHDLHAVFPEIEKEPVEETNYVQHYGHNSGWMG